MFNRTKIGFISLSFATACQSPDQSNSHLFVEVALSSGLEFTHFNGMSGQLYYPEIMGSGGGFLDYDQDGDLDIYLVQGALLDSVDSKQLLFQPTAELKDRLFRNDGISDSSKLVFTDITEASGLDARGYGMGVAVGDVDNNGYPDLYVSNFGPNELWLNQGDGTFLNRSQELGVADPSWSVSASFVDVDADGWLDLYVGNYVDFSLANHKVCQSTTSADDYCSPKVYLPQTDRLFKNTGGSFVDVSRESGITETFGAALGVLSTDVNNDGKVDIYVANDGMANQLWMNQGAGRFQDAAPLAGVAVNLNGAAEASMGVDAADFDNDGDDDLFMTHLARETNTLYVNNGKGWFEDRTVAFGLGSPSLVATGFGTAWFDYDMDGLLDLYSANGAVTSIESQRQSGNVYPLNQANQLFRNTAQGFQEVSSLLGHEEPRVSRGVATGDVDNDGDIDILVTNNSGPVELLLNSSTKSTEWIGFDLRNVDNQTAIGARIGLRLNNGAHRWSKVRRDGSYASSRDPRVTLSINNAIQPLQFTVVWPGGYEVSYTEDFAAGKYHVIRDVK